MTSNYASSAPSTLTTKDMYRRAVLDQMELINQAKIGAFQADSLRKIALGLMGVYTLLYGLRNYLYVYIHKEIDKEGRMHTLDKYNIAFENIKLNFGNLFPNPDEETLRKFIVSLAEWEALLTIYFSEAGLLPAKRVVVVATNSVIENYREMEDLYDGIRKLIPASRNKKLLEWLDEEIKFASAKPTVDAYRHSGDEDRPISPVVEPNSE